MSKIFIDANEKYLAFVVAYLNSTDNILYKNYDSTADTAYTNPIEKEELENLFTKGFLLINDGTSFIKPMSLTFSTGYSSVSWFAVESSTVTAVTAYSKGYTGV